MLRKLASVLGAAVLLAACGGDEEAVYPLSAKQVRSILVDPQTTALPKDLGFEPTLMASDSTAVRWRIVMDDEVDLGHIAARIEEVEPGQTRVIVSAEPMPDERARMLAEKLPSYGNLMEFYRKAMVEQIDARIEKRPFNAMAIGAQAAVTAISVARDFDSGRADALKAEHEHEMRESMEGAEGTEPEENADLPTDDWGSAH